MSGSGDWMLKIFIVGEYRFYDFNGWPGDTENGKGWIFNGEVIEIFNNSAQNLYSIFPEYDNIISHYEEIRLNITKSFFDGL